MNPIQLLTICVMSMVVALLANVYLLFDHWYLLIGVVLFFVMLFFYISGWAFFMKGSIDFICERHNKDKENGSLRRFLEGEYQG
jgi:hypothetical protein